MKIRPVVSIIVPAYNVEDYIADCLKSLVSQTYRDVHIIVIDNASTDGTAQIVHSFANRYKKIELISEVNPGAASARNAGLRKALGEFLMFVDADDMLAPNTIEDNIRFLNENKELDWVSFPIRRMRKDGKPVVLDREFLGFFPRVDRVICKADFIPAYFAGELSELCCGSIFRRSAVSDIYFPVGEYYEDSFYFTECMVKTRCGMLSTHGEYQYIERDNSSQHATLTCARLRSKMNSLLHRIEQFSLVAPHYKSNYRDMECSMYNYLLYHKSNGNQFAGKILKEFLKRIGYRPYIGCKTRLKYLLMRLHIYDALMSLYHFCAK